MRSWPSAVGSYLFILCVFLQILNYFIFHVLVHSGRHPLLSFIHVRSEIFE